jgi:hypothetical protein
VNVQDRELSTERLLELNASTTLLVVGDLTASSTYSFSVWAENQAGLSGPAANIDSTSTAIGSPPDPTPTPTLIKATGGALYLRILAPVNLGGAAITQAAVHYGRETGTGANFQSYGTIPITKPVVSGGVIGNVSIYGLLSSSRYRIVVLLQNRFVSI